ncbi:colicin immunity protein ImmE2 [Pseudomonas fluorescens HK44]|uniref:Colicin immunity protein ImmE2 n=1 Tax=Pseudomonas fluorescens HK44 TaxID=1042209 RepID=A0A010S2R2_PSEFL|nr:bacteriocin immunity protein [Pseudomonas fluorescens]EXF95064.1 colicin immunity protein ImmE2 [Pseudomonas fluorescens HK44]
MELKSKLSDYTESEFIDFINEIKFGSNDEAEEDKLIFHFKKVVGHPAGSDLIFYPENKIENTAKEIIQTLKEWRAVQGLPGFRD